MDTTSTHNIWYASKFDVTGATFAPSSSHVLRYMSHSPLAPLLPKIHFLMLKKKRWGQMGLSSCAVGLLGALVRLISYHAWCSNSTSSSGLDDWQLDAAMCRRNWRMLALSGSLTLYFAILISYSHLVRVWAKIYSLSPSLSLYVKPAILPIRAFHSRGPFRASLGSPSRSLPRTAFPFPHTPEQLFTHLDNLLLIASPTSNWLPQHGNLILLVIFVMKELPYTKFLHRRGATIKVWYLRCIFCSLNDSLVWIDSPSQTSHSICNGQYIKAPFHLC